jgi:hypothetical protein
VESELSILELSNVPPTVPVFLPRKVRFAVGVDLGQSSDPTAIAVLQHTTGFLDPNSPLERHNGTGLKPQVPAERLDVRHLERLPLGMSYPAMVEHVRQLMARPPLNGDARTKPAELILDQTGVGAAVADIFEVAGMSPVRISITAGSEATPVRQNSWHVAKTILISTVDAMLHTGTLRFAAALSDAPAMKDELLNFRRRLSDAGRATYAARTGTHDDLVLAVSISAWWLSRPPPQRAMFGSY